MEILKVVTDGKRRVIVFRRDDGLFGFTTEEQVQVYDEELAKRFNDYTTS
jgi:hypothetical protein